MEEILNQNIPSIHNLLKNREISCSEFLNLILDNIHKSSLNTYITLLENEAIDSAKDIDKTGEFENLLTGIPIAIKDNICIRDFPVTCGSKILKNFIPNYDATVIAKLREAKTIFIGKTNLDEFAMGSSTENSAFGATFNPFDQNLVPGGSSGGSAACVKALEAICALGSDTGGSIRQPAAFCGVVGLKPTYGLVSRYGLVAFASSLDQIGPIGKYVEDVAILLDAIAGEDQKDSTSYQGLETFPTGQYYKNLKVGVKRLKIGIPKEYFAELSIEIKDKIMASAQCLEKEGAEICEISLPHTSYAIPIYYLIATAEASANLARYDGVRYGYRSSKVSARDYDGKGQKSKLREMYENTRTKGFGDEVKRRIMLGTFALQSGYYDEYYLKACKVRTLITEDFKNAFKKVNLILTPVTPTPPFKLGELIKDPLEMYLSDVFTVPINLAGLPAISINGGFINNLPIGFQLIGRQFEEQIILNTAYTYQEINKTDFCKMEN